MPHEAYTPPHRNVVNDLPKMKDEEISVFKELLNAFHDATGFLMENEKEITTYVGRLYPMEAEPEDESTKPPMGGVTSDLFQELEKIKRMNTRLYRCVKHLRKVVGD